MDEDDIRGRIDRLKAQVQMQHEARQAFLAALEAVDQEALSALNALRASIISLQDQVPEAKSLREPSLGQRNGPPEREQSTEDRSLWHNCVISTDPGPEPPLSPRLSTDLLGTITYDPIRKEWRCGSLGGNAIALEAVLAAYSDRLVHWVVHAYPREKRRREEAGRTAAAEAQRAEEKAIREAEFDAYIAGTPNAMALGCVAIVVGIVVLLVVLNLLIGAQFR